MTEWLRFSEGCYAAGQPTTTQLAALAAAGVRTVINLRTPREQDDADEVAVLQRLGVAYLRLPIASAADLERERVRQFGQALDRARRDGDVLVHCASANRVGALVALDQAFNRGQTPSEALAVGRSAGLAALEPAVIALLGLPA
ncbi:fused DSP-PTPase phosphatase/NAD kinase-like protein [Xanthomonas maliensis]|uniref:fused DSP-PTPase phosphatase/NAD kinase-like protein n=1 Tax=Xanthomonas maliensis TaxID=1321368 RepID=UPI0003B499A3|nr:sulfur transferase domain-containing protein [Xanthomonas maliensis]KAB7770106.1 hypothetical protein CKY51_04965 [Xanthomonas maliensis]